MSFLAALYAASLLILSPAAVSHAKPRPYARLLLPEVPQHELPTPELQPTAPRGFQSSAPQQFETDRRQGYGVTKQDLGTESLPLVVKIEGTVKNEVSPTRDKPKADEKPTTDWVAVFTAGLIVVGLIQSIVFGLQAYFLNRTIRKMDGIATGQKSDTQSLITTAQAQERVMKRHADIAERSLTAHRPFVFFHGLHGSQVEHKNAFKGDDPKDWDEIDYVFRLQFSTPYTLANQGRTVAVIHEVWLALRALEFLPEVPATDYVEAREANIRKPKVALAMIVPDVPFSVGTVAIDPPTIDDKVRIRRILAGSKSYFLYGFIRYSDIIVGQTYLTGQAFRYDQRAKGFIVVGGQGYNYDRRLDDPSRPAG